MARELSKKEWLVLLCGHYEGVDERALAQMDMEVSIGDYVLTGGELPAMVLIDCVSRFIPGVLGCQDSAEEESFSDGLLEYPQYTRPAEYRGMAVPPVLLNGNHAHIAGGGGTCPWPSPKNAGPERFCKRRWIRKDQAFLNSLETCEDPVE